MSAAPAYDFAQFSPAPAIASPAPSRTRNSQPQFKVTTNPQTRTQAGLDSQLVFFAKVVAAVLLLVTMLCMVRLTLSSATVATALENQKLEKSIDATRTSSTTLEVAQSKLSTPARVKEMAKTQGMESATDIMMIDLSGDIVVTNSHGSLSLSGSIAALSNKA